MKKRKTPVYVCATDKKEMLVLTANECAVFQAIEAQPLISTKALSEQVGIAVPSLRVILNRMKKADFIRSSSFPNEKGGLEHHHEMLIGFNIYENRTF